MGTEEDNALTLQEAQRLEALEREIAELRHENTELRGSGPPRSGGGRMMIGKLTRRVRMAFASSGALSVVVVLLVLTAGVAVAASNATFNAETLNGTEQADTIDGLAGIDKMYGLGGNDTLKGNEGKDTVQGGEGKDTVEGGEGNDTIDLGPGNDGGECSPQGCTGGYGGPGNDTIKGGDGYNVLKGEGGDDKLILNPGHGFMFGGPGKNTYTGGPNGDAIYANVDEANGGAKEVINAGAGNDSIYADEGLPDQIKCGDGNDTVLADYPDSVDSVSADCETVNPPPPPD